MMELGRGRMLLPILAPPPKSPELLGKSPPFFSLVSLVSSEGGQRAENLRGVWGAASLEEEADGLLMMRPLA